MEEIPWIEVGNRYTAELQYGRLVIEPTIPGPYTARIETHSGRVIATMEVDLDGCKAWAQVHLPLLDEAPGKFADCGNVVETLDVCQRLFSPDMDAVYWLRIEYIRAWMAKHGDQPYTVTEISLPESSYDNLNWVEQGTEFVVDTPHGRAVIQEVREKNVIGGGIKHKARIIHHSGAELDCYSWWIDFMEAEAAIQERLRSMDKRDLGDTAIVDFTLNVCKHILPVDTDPIHYARLNMLGTLIHFAFD